MKEGVLAQTGYDIADWAKRNLKGSSNFSSLQRPISCSTQLLNILSYHTLLFENSEIIKYTNVSYWKGIMPLK